MMLARHVERLGFDAFWYPDERFYRDTYVGLTACSLATEHIRVGTAVTDPYSRHPALTAVAMASLAEVSQGRATLGIGAGISGFAQLGLQPGRAAVALREAIDLIRRLWRGERVTCDGEFIRAQALSLDFTVRTAPPVYIAADGNATLRLAGAIGDGVIVMHCASPLTLQDKLSQVRIGMDRVERSVQPRVVARLDVSIAEDRATAMRQAKLRLGRYLWARYPRITYLEQHRLQLPDALATRLAAAPFRRTHDLTAFAGLADIIPDELVGPIALAGTPSDITTQLRAVVEAGADEIMLYPVVPDGSQMEDCIELLGSTIPALRRVAGPRANPFLNRL